MREYYRNHPEHRKQVLKKLKQKYNKDPEYYREKSREWRKENPEIMSKQNEDYRKSHQEEIQNYLKEYREGPKRNELLERKKKYYNNLKKKNPKLLLNWNINDAERRWELKETVLLMYSPKGSTFPKCCCCEEWILEFLTLDHIDGRGKIERKNIGTGMKWYRWVKTNKPKNLQTLCINCNFGKQLTPDKKCPHELLR